MSALLQDGVEAARNARRQEAADGLIFAARERALEVALDAVAQIDELEPNLFRDAVRRLLSESEMECRTSALMVASCFLAAGASHDDPAVTELVRRALR